MGKAEFDSLKNDFQSQIDQYNTSIDAKIDGAIASYLAGVKVAVDKKLTIPVTNYADIIWKNDLYFKIKDRTWTTTNDYTDGPFYMLGNRNGYGSPELNGIVYDTGAPKLRNLNKSFSEPKLQHKWETENQMNKDLSIAKNIFLATNTNTEVNMALELSTQGPTAHKTYDYTDSEYKTVSFDSGTLNCSINGLGGSVNRFYFIDDSGAQVTPTFGLPLWPRYKLKDIYSATFKKSNFNDGVEDNYLVDDEGDTLKNVNWEPSSTNTDYEVTIPVKSGDSVWMRFGPKDTQANGLYAKITNIDCRLIAE